jgi:hypothetical protein
MVLVFDACGGGQTGESKWAQTSDFVEGFSDGARYYWNSVTGESVWADAPWSGSDGAMRIESAIPAPSSPLGAAGTGRQPGGPRSGGAGSAGASASASARGPGRGPPTHPQTVVKGRRVRWQTKDGGATAGAAPRTPGADRDTEEARQRRAEARRQRRRQRARARAAGTSSSSSSSSSSSEHSTASSDSDESGAERRALGRAAPEFVKGPDGKPVLLSLVSQFLLRWVSKAAVTVGHTLAVTATTVGRTVANTATCRDLCVHLPIRWVDVGWGVGCGLRDGLEGWAQQRAL